MPNKNKKIAKANANVSASTADDANDDSQQAVLLAIESLKLDLMAKM